ncbi:MAG: hypothetical protein R3E68_22130 [Burkholderiaceae bacterium]
MITDLAVRPRRERPGARADLFVTAWGEVTGGVSRPDWPRTDRGGGGLAGEPAGLPARLTLRADGRAGDFKAVLRGQVAGAIADVRADLRLLEPVPVVRVPR